MTGEKIYLIYSTVILRVQRKDILPVILSEATAKSKYLIKYRIRIKSDQNRSVA